MRSRNRRGGLVVAALCLLSGLGLIAWGNSRTMSGTVSLHPTIQLPPSAVAPTDAKLASILDQLQRVYQREGLNAAREFALRNGLIDAAGTLRLSLELDSTDPAAAAEVIAQLGVWGVQIEGQRPGALAVAVTLAQLGQTLALPTVGSGTPLALVVPTGTLTLPVNVLQGLARLQHIRRIHLPEKPHPFALTQASANEGVHLVHADRWQQAGFLGSGIKVGVLDPGGFKGYAAQLGSALPPTVQLRAFNHTHDIEGNGEDSDIDRVHGTACAAIVHSMAPQADLYLAAFDTNEEAAVNWLLDQGVQIISASFGDPYHPPDGNSVGSRLVDQVRARGVLWVNAAGNEGARHYHDHFHADTTGATVFADGSNTLGLQAAAQGYAQIILRWDDWQRHTIDYDLYLMDAKGNEVTHSADIQNGGSNPTQEVIHYLVEADTAYYLVVQAAQGTPAVDFDIFVDGPAQLERSEARGSLLPPADARGALAVGAVQWQTDTRADYSSEGPTSDGRLKPDLAAPAGVSSPSYLGAGGFSGTSAAAPQVAGAAALVWGSRPDQSAADVQTYLLTRALDLGTPGPDIAYGVGRLDLTALPSTNGPGTLPPVATPALPTVGPASTVGAAATAAAPSSSSWLVPLGIGMVLGSLLVAGSIWLFSRRGAGPQHSPVPPVSAARPAIAPPSHLPASTIHPAVPPPVVPRPVAPLPPHALSAPAPSIIAVTRPTPPPPMPPTTRPSLAPTAAAPPARVFCPTCGRMLNRQSGRCDHCGGAGP